MSGEDTLAPRSSHVLSLPLSLPILFNNATLHKGARRIVIARQQQSTTTAAAGNRPSSPPVVPAIVCATFKDYVTAVQNFELTPREGNDQEEGEDEEHVREMLLQFGDYLFTTAPTTFSRSLPKPRRQRTEEDDEDDDDPHTLVEEYVDLSALYPLPSILDMHLAILATVTEDALGLMNSTARSDDDIYKILLGLESALLVAANAKANEEVELVFRSAESRSSNAGTTHSEEAVTAVEQLMPYLSCCGVIDFLLAAGYQRTGDTLFFWTTASRPSFSLLTAIAVVQQELQWIEAAKGEASHRSHTSMNSSKRGPLAAKSQAPTKYRKTVPVSSRMGEFLTQFESQQQRHETACANKLPSRVLAGGTHYPTQDDIVLWVELRNFFFLMFLFSGDGAEADIQRDTWAEYFNMSREALTEAIERLRDAGTQFTSNPPANVNQLLRDGSLFRRFVQLSAAQQQQQQHSLNATASSSFTGGRGAGDAAAGLFGKVDSSIYLDDSTPPTLSSAPPSQSDTPQIPSTPLVGMTPPPLSRRSMGGSMARDNAYSSPASVISAGDCLTRTPQHELDRHLFRMQQPASIDECWRDPAETRCGLYNIRQSCFVNAIIQILSGMSVFVSAVMLFPAAKFLRECGLEVTLEAKVAHRWQALFAYLSCSQSVAANPAALMDAVAACDERFAEGSQQDISEFVLTGLQLVVRAFEQLVKACDVEIAAKRPAEDHSCGEEATEEDRHSITGDPQRWVALRDVLQRAQRLFTSVFQGTATILAPRLTATSTSSTTTPNQSRQSSWEVRQSKEGTDFILPCRIPEHLLLSSQNDEEDDAESCRNKKKEEGNTNTKCGAESSHSTTTRHVDPTMGMLKGTLLESENATPPPSSSSSSSLRFFGALEDLFVTCAAVTPTATTDGVAAPPPPTTFGTLRCWQQHHNQLPHMMILYFSNRVEVQLETDPKTGQMHVASKRNNSTVAFPEWLAFPLVLGAAEEEETDAGTTSKETRRKDDQAEEGVLRRDGNGAWDALQQLYRSKSESVSLEAEKAAVDALLKSLPLQDGGGSGTGKEKKESGQGTSLQRTLAKYRSAACSQALLEWHRQVTAQQQDMVAAESRRAECRAQLLQKLFSSASHTTLDGFSRTPADEQADATLFRVCGVVLHFGSTADSGHYVSYVFSHKRWWRCDDVRVTPMEPHFAPWKDEEVQSNVYALVYQQSGNHRRPSHATKEEGGAGPTQPLSGLVSGKMDHRRSAGGGSNGGGVSGSPGRAVVFDVEVASTHEETLARILTEQCNLCESLRSNMASSSSTTQTENHDDDDDDEEQIHPFIPPHLVRLVEKEDLRRQLLLSQRLSEEC